MFPSIKYAYSCTITKLVLWRGEMLDRKEEIWYFYAHQRYVIVENFFESYCDLCRVFGQLTWRSL